MKWNTVRVFIFGLHVALLTSGWWAFAVFGAVLSNGFPLIMPIGILTAAMVFWIIPTLDGEWNK